MNFEDLLKLVPKDPEREELRRLGRQFSEARQARAGSPGSREAQLLDQIMHEVQLQFRAIRHPMPQRQDVEAMIVEHYKKSNP